VSRVGVHVSKHLLQDLIMQDDPLNRAVFQKHKFRLEVQEMKMYGMKVFHLMLYTGVL
jgi:hypothetical protein